MLILINTDLLFDTKTLKNYSKENTDCKTKKEFVNSILEEIKQRRKDNMKFQIISPTDDEKISFIFTTVNTNLQKERLKTDINFSTKTITVTELDESYEYINENKKVSNEIYFKDKVEVEGYITNLLNCSNLRSIYFCDQK